MRTNVEVGGNWHFLVLITLVVLMYTFIITEHFNSGLVLRNNLQLEDNVQAVNVALIEVSRLTKEKGK